MVLTELGASLCGVVGSTRGAIIDDDVITSSPQAEIVALLARWPSASPFVEELADHSGRDVEALWDNLLAAEREGLVETWPDHPVAPAAMLSSLAASRLGLRLSADGSRWLGPRDHDPTSVDPSLEFRTEADCVDDQDRTHFLDALPDPLALDGLATLMADEDNGHQWRDFEDAWFDQDQGSGPEVLFLDRAPSHDELWGAAEREQRIVVLPAPRLLLGLGTSWPVPTPGSNPPRIWRPGDGPCPVCFERPLSKSTLCLLCLRSGVDHLIREMDRRSPPRVAQPRRDTDKPSRATKATGCQVGKAQILRGGIG